MTICIVALLGKRTKQEWYEWIKESVENETGHPTPWEIDAVFNQPSHRVPPPTTEKRSVDARQTSSSLPGKIDDTDSESEGEGAGQGRSTLRLSEAMAGALGGAGIVFRPGTQTDKDGDVIYEAHVANEDEDMETDKVQELDEKGQEEAGKREAASSGGNAPRPDLSHQAEIVTSPPGGKGVEVRPSTEGPALAKEKETSGAGAMNLTDKSEDPTKTT
jgi:protein phosphatase 2C family protein 2/3